MTMRQEARAARKEFWRMMEARNAVLRCPKCGEDRRDELEAHYLSTRASTWEEAGYKREGSGYVGPSGHFVIGNPPCESRDCPDGEHLHLKCACGFRWSQACADADTIHLDDYADIAHAPEGTGEVARVTGISESGAPIVDRCDGGRPIQRPNEHRESYRDRVREWEQRRGEIKPSPPATTEMYDLLYREAPERVEVPIEIAPSPKQLIEELQARVDTLEGAVMALAGIAYDLHPVMARVTERILTHERAILIHDELRSVMDSLRSSGVRQQRDTEA